MKSVNVEVIKAGTENNANTIRKFTKRVQEAGILRRVRGIRYKDRNRSKYVTKKKTLSSLDRKAKIEVLIKLGKNVEKPRRR
ncbi:MAG: hypothetical protein WCF92_02400 [bacterium]